MVEKECKDGHKLIPLGHISIRSRKDASVEVSSSEVMECEYCDWMECVLPNSVMY